MKRNLLKVLLFSSLSVLVYFSLFHKLGYNQIRMWDEATYANNALDMFQHGNYLVVSHLEKPDMYNTKPPFAIWMMYLSLKIFGLNEFAIRFPSALFSLLTCLILYLFSAKVLKSQLIGIVSVLVLISSQGYVYGHVSRTGDFDAILVFWMTFYFLTFLKIIIDKPANNRIDIFLLSAGIVFAFYTKGIAGFFFLPFMVIITLFNGNYKYIFKTKRFIFAAIAVIIFCLSYYLYRESVTPGYLKLVCEGEITRIHSDVASWLVHPFGYYIESLQDYRYVVYIYVIPLTLLSWFTAENQTVKKTVMYLFITSLGLTLLISYPPVKLPWYDAPLFPLFALLIGLFTFTLFQKIAKLDVRWRNIIKPISILLGVAAFSYSYCLTINNHHYEEESIYDMELDGHMLRKMSMEHPEYKQVKVLREYTNIEHIDQVLFYKRILELNSGYSIQITSDTLYQKGDILITNQEKFKQIIESNYNHSLIETFQNEKLYRIN